MVWTDCVIQIWQNLLAFITQKYQFLRFYIWIHIIVFLDHIYTYMNIFGQFHNSKYIHIRILIVSWILGTIGYIELLFDGKPYFIYLQFVSNPSHMKVIRWICYDSLNFGTTNNVIRHYVIAWNALTVLLWVVEWFYWSRTPAVLEKLIVRNKRKWKFIYSISIYIKNAK